MGIRLHEIVIKIRVCSVFTCENAATIRLRCFSNTNSAQFALSALVFIRIIIMSTLEDKILDGPRVHYCEADDDDIRDPEPEGTKSVARLFRPAEDEERTCQPTSLRSRTLCQPATNTGPKGVIEDHKNQDIEAEFDELMKDDSIIKNLIAKRLAEVPEFGSVQHLASGEEFLKAVDKERPDVLVIVHIYGKRSRSCLRLNECLKELASSIRRVKFMTLDVGVTNLSPEFKANGIPTLQAYKGGKLTKSLVKIDENLDKDFEAADVKEFLVENGFFG